MSIDCIGASRSTTPRVVQGGTSFTLPVDWHRTRIHVKPQHGCPDCPPVPCVCGHAGSTCPDAFEHRRGFAGAESTWREAAA
jgi:hypothetical protein